MHARWQSEPYDGRLIITRHAWYIQGVTHWDANNCNSVTYASIFCRDRANFYGLRVLLSLGDVAAKTEARAFVNAQLQAKSGHIRSKSLHCFEHLFRGPTAYPSSMSNFAHPPWRRTVAYSSLTASWI